jgi:PDZ domain-containing protein
MSTDPGSPRRREPMPNRRHRIWSVPLVVIVMVFVGVVLVQNFRTVGYYAVAPGDATSAQKRVVLGAGVDHFASKGQVLFVTVREPQLTALARWVADQENDVEVVAKQRILGNQTPEENRQENLKLMTYSKDFAAFVALKHLGYPVKVSDGGVSIASLCLESTDGKTCSKEAPAAAVLKVGDIITGIDGTPINITSDISPVLAGKKDGDVVKVTVKRGSDTLTVDAPLTSDSGRVILGIIPDPDPPVTTQFQLPLDVSIDSGEVGGPSAGLAFTLALLDELTPGDITGGAKVAATGTISLDGRVGAIGGLPQKAVAVRDAGAKVFMVPASQSDDEIAQANRYTNDELQIVRVATLDEALTELATLGGNALALGTPGAVNG